MTEQGTLEAITSSRVVAIVREGSADAAKREVERLVEAGIRVVEVSLSTPGALEVARWMADEMDAEGLHFGVGTVLAAHDVEEAAATGASFIVSPISRAGLISTCKELGLVSIVGAMTPTECVVASDGGADLLKLFPANMWTLDALKGLLQALPELRLVPTGGITLSSAKTWLDAGAVAVGMGSALRTTGSVRPLQAALEALALVGSAGLDD
ncbi:bifunctional 4-hydroxy-2-oxoglutarate aldolase/2-dehydro-3-deoxy-phosphogluconate aldolase [Leifsonia bigeumensis]|uniref:Bifunctional 4-hydroxy-2-oxoglutarate aldolase/2-dehydro-3-deoxy-phosphogluconate aldolase n=1 Tax=Leifsonella bigeumensis TaxID=433643 RepID=A0ABP7FC23_9MICO